eukprot:1596509-Alexandrium_andersonii.AAC.1
MLDSAAPRGIGVDPDRAASHACRPFSILRNADFIEDIALRQRLASHCEDAGQKAAGVWIHLRVWFGRYGN